MHKLGLLGKNISYSFSRTYFKEKFKREDISNVSYENFDLDSIEMLPNLIESTPKLKGFNITIPYKEAVIPYLDKLNKKAQQIGAVNTVRLSKKGKLIGFNTDCFGFKKSINPLLKEHHKSALILGTGGASKAIAYTFKTIGIPYYYVSRRASENVSFTYDTLTEEIIKQHFIIVNCTPLGTFPNITECPNIPYNAITKNHVLYDLIYNPDKTQFLKNGENHGAKTCNGLRMLELQAEKAWAIWNLH